MTAPSERVLLGAWRAVLLAAVVPVRVAWWCTLMGGLSVTWCALRAASLTADWCRR